MPRSTLGYPLRRPHKEAPFLAAMRALSSQYPRYGYRRIRFFLRHQGLAMSPSHAERLWSLGKLQRPRRRVSTARPRPLPPRVLEAAKRYFTDLNPFRE